MTLPVAERRAAGVLLHITSLPGAHGSGDLGPHARAFVDFLARAGQRYWQTLPIHPVGAGFSPYAGASAFAGNPALISLDDLVAEGLLRASELEHLPSGTAAHHARAAALREEALRKAFVRYRSNASFYAAELKSFRDKQAFWLDDYALFCAARKHGGERSWTRFGAGLRRRDPAALSEARARWEDEIHFVEFVQLMFERQWQTLRTHARARGIQLIGDVPIFVAHDSADVWSHQRMFLLDEHGEPTHVSGVPPDYFSETGQRWGTPLYRWQALSQVGYRFWVERMRSLLERFDLVRLDHFIGFARYWEIPAHEETAVGGRWVAGPGAALFDTLERALAAESKDGKRAPLPFIAEDLGCVNRSVRALRDQFALPGMRVLQFGFSPEEGTANVHLPHAYPRRCVAYTGTHDSNTVVGWWKEEVGRARAGESAADVEGFRRKVLAYLHGPHEQASDARIHLAMIRALYASHARLVIVPMQDWLGQGSEARMNVPGRAEDNWTYRVRAEALSDELAETMRGFARAYGRYSESHTESEPAGQENSATP